MNKLVKKLLSLCSVCIMLVTLLPQAAFEEVSASGKKAVYLSGMTGLSIKANQMAPAVKINVTDEHGNVISDSDVKVNSTRWKRACDGAEMSTGGFFHFESGTEYYYVIGLNFDDPALEFDLECEFYLDGSKLTDDNILMRDSKYTTIRTNGYLTDGTPLERLEQVELSGIRQPLSTDSGQALISTISTPAGEPYSIASAEWYVYDEAKRKYVRSDDFQTSSVCLLILSFNVDVGYGLSNNTIFNLTNSSEPRKITPKTLLFDPVKDKPEVRIYYNIKGPSPKTVTLDANGGSFVGHDGASTIEMQTLNNGKIEGLPTETSIIKKEESYLEGWFTQRDGGEKVEADKIYYNNTTIYAHWKPIIEEVRFYIIEPMNGRKPVLYKHGTEKYTAYQLIQGQGPTGKRFSDNADSNSFLESIGGIIERYSSSEKYDYYATAKAIGEEKFTDETKVYINDVECSNNLTRPSNKLQASKTYYCANEYTFKVFNRMPAEIPAGISGMPINFDLNDYISCTGNYGVTGDAEFDDYGLTITGGRYITGVYPSTATGEKTFTMTVTSESGESATLPVHIGRTETEPFIASISDDAVTECTESVSFNVTVCAPEGATVTYDWQISDKTTYLSIKEDLIDGGFIDGNMFTGYTSPTLRISNKSPISTLYKCVVKVNGVEVKKGINGNLIRHKVKHKFDEYAQKDVTNHSRICNRCSYKNSDGDTITYKEDQKHLYRYELVKEATESNEGHYKKICTKCGQNSLHEFSQSDTQGDAIIIFRDKSGYNKILNTKKYQKIQIPKGYRPYKSGYSFLGWTVDEDALTVDYLPGEEIFTALDGMSLYAVYAENVIIVDGVTVNADNVSEMFGNEVEFTPGTSVTAPKLTLNNAHIGTHPIYGEVQPVGIYATANVDIELIGDNIIEAGSVNAIGIAAGGTVSLSGDGTLTIKGANTMEYDKGIKAAGIENLAEKLYIKDCGTAIDGKTTLAYGKTEIYWGNYSGESFKAFTQVFSQSDYSPMKIIGAKDKESLSIIISAADAPDTWYALIAPADISFLNYNQELKAVIGFTPENARVYCSQHNENGVLKTVKIIYGNTEDNIPTDSRVMLLSKDGLRPLCEPIIIEK